MDVIEVVRFTNWELQVWAGNDLHQPAVTFMQALDHYFNRVLQHGWRLKSSTTFIDRTNEVWTVVWQHSSGGEKGPCQLEDLQNG